MSRRVRVRCAAAACVLAAVIILGSCEFPGFLGDSFTIEGTVYEETSTGSLASWDNGDGLVTLRMMDGLGGTTNLFAGTLVDGVLSVDVTVPDAAKLKSWTAIMPSQVTVTVSPDSARACVVNSIIFEDSSNPIEYRAPDETKWVFWVYSDSDAQLNASGSDVGLPGGAWGSMEMNIELKKGWNIIVLTRALVGATRGDSYTDTYAVGELPEGLDLIYPYQPPG